jgi:hypothetical protein
MKYGISLLVKPNNIEILIEQIYKRDTVIVKLVAALDGYVGNGHDPTGSDVHQPEKCHQCKLEEALSYAKSMIEGGAK